MSAPAPATVKVPFENEAPPAVPTLPTSVDAHGDGTLPPGGGGGGGGGVPLPPVVNDQIGDSATSDALRTVALVRDTIFQKYVVPPASALLAVHEYVLGGLFTSCAGT